MPHRPNPAPRGRPRPAAVRRLLGAAAATALLALTVTLASPAGADGDGVIEVTPLRETTRTYDVKADTNLLDPTQVPAGAALGDADDPAIWVHPLVRPLSLIIGTVKNGGLQVHTLDGTLCQSITPLPDPLPDDGEDTPGRFNNVDLVYGFRLGHQKVDLAVVTDRGYDTLRIYRIDPVRLRLVDVTGPALASTAALPAGNLFGVDLAEQESAYGVATWSDRATGRHYAFVNQRSNARVDQFRLVPGPHGTVEAERVRSIEFPGEYPDWLIEDDDELIPGPEDPQFEGMVVDRRTATLYAGQEQVGIWRLSARPDATDTPELIDTVNGFCDTCTPAGGGAPSSGALEADVEGLTVYYGPGTSGYLIASSQGDDTFAVYERDGNEYLGSFRLGAGPKADATEESDGAAVVGVDLYVPGMRGGLFVSQDGSDEPEVLGYDEGDTPEDAENVVTNFTYVSWEAIARAFPTPLLVTPRADDPRR